VEDTLCQNRLICATYPVPPGGACFDPETRNCISDIMEDDCLDFFGPEAVWTPGEECPYEGESVPAVGVQAYVLLSIVLLAAGIYLRLRRSVSA